MSARANWFVEPVDAVDEQDDPWAMPIEEVGERVDLRDPRGALELRLRELMHRESNLFNVGITCPIKDQPETACHACPVSQAREQDSALAPLCRIGREQESTLTELAVLRWRGE